MAWLECYFLRNLPLEASLEIFPDLFTDWHLTLLYFLPSTYLYLKILVSLFVDLLVAHLLLLKCKKYEP